ncbi:uncharacterized protein LOC122018757 isoform X2 [Zingiber officinale]|uniref:uncharacterized protein LOC122018757 isoform X2 n=1 Tax=Zingiber officinale TaxID=94328 RepID=UPI001C4BA8D7|nr:uncharacterized protein LOC122018757 isoform X2 [Zingiber officinale]
MKALLCLRAAVPTVICASKANTGTGFGLLGRCLSLSFPRSTGPFIRSAPLCSCSVKPPTPTTPTPASEDPDSDQDGQERDVEIAQGTSLWMEPWEVLLDHIFGPPDKLVVQLLDPVKELGLVIGNTEYNALLALVQVYFNLKDYENAKIIHDMIRNAKQHSEMDSRPHLLEAILNLTLAVEKLQQRKITENGARELIENAKESWGRYKELKEEGFGLQAPPEAED